MDATEKFSFEIVCPEEFVFEVDEDPPVEVEPVEFDNNK